MAGGDGGSAEVSSPDCPASGELGSDHLMEMYRQMVICRTLDERVWMLNRQGKAAIVASAQGHEACQIGSVHALRTGQDQFYTNYRDLAVLLTLGMTPREIMLSFLAKEGERMSGARQFPLHGAYPKLCVVNLSNVVGTQIPQAAGAALAAKMRGDDTVVIVYFGDGASSVGECHEAMNFAGVHRLPVIFFCENNGYAISVPRSRQMAVANVASRATGYGMPGIVVDGCDITAVYEATWEAANRARTGEGPTLIEAMVERYLPHTSDDDDRRYRAAKEIAEARKRDPLKILKKRLVELGVLSEKVDEGIYSEAKRDVNDATEFAESAEYPLVDSLYDHVHADWTRNGPSR